MSMPTADGGARPIGFGALANLADPEVNRQAREVFEAMVRSRVDDPAIAEDLIPTDYPIGCKRLVVEIGYFETFNRPNVRLVNLRKTPIDEITETSVRVGDESISIDVLVLATGFDAVTGPLSRIDVRGVGGTTLVKKWKESPKAYLGILPAGFPNLFTVNGPGSPSVLSNVMVSIEQHVDWIADAIAYLETKGVRSFDADEHAEQQWMDHVAEAAVGSVFTAGCDSWYLGSNVEGKPVSSCPTSGASAATARSATTWRATVIAASYLLLRRILKARAARHRAVIAIASAAVKMS
jgi:cyclohexanone monooxygenase